MRNFHRWMPIGETRAGKGGGVILVVKVGRGRRAGRSHGGGVVLIHVY